MYIIPQNIVIYISTMNNLSVDCECMCGNTGIKMKMDISM